VGRALLSVFIKTGGGTGIEKKVGMGLLNSLKTEIVDFTRIYVG
jgi:hypothetical protein